MNAEELSGLIGAGVGVLSVLFIFALLRSTNKQRSIRGTMTGRKVKFTGAESEETYERDIVHVTFEAEVDADKRKLRIGAEGSSEDVREVTGALGQFLGVDSEAIDRLSRDAVRLDDGNRVRSTFTVIKRSRCGSHPDDSIEFEVVG